MGRSSREQAGRNWKRIVAWNVFTPATCFAN
jgi:hypothetical protein